MKVVSCAERRGRNDRKGVLGMKKIRGWLVFLLTLSLVLVGTAVPQSVSAAKKKVKLSRTTATVKVGGKVKITVKNAGKKVKWSVRSGKKYISLKNTKKKTVTVQGKKAGNAKIQAKVGKKKLTCKIKVQKKGGSGSKDDKTITGTPGKNIALPAGTTVFNVGGRKLALGIKRSAVNTILGSMSNDIIRKEKSPQGFDVIAYNPGGSYNGYILVYLKNDIVVGLCAIGKNVQYGEGNKTIVSTGTSAETLEKKGAWSAENLFDAKAGGVTVGTGAYKYTASSPAATVLAYVDCFRKTGKRVYCIQVYSNAYSRSTMLDPNYCTYDDPSVLTAMKLETAELLNAYCVFCGFRTLTKIDGLAKAAQDYCDASVTKSDEPPAEQKPDDLKTAVLEQNGKDAPLHFAQITMSMSSDSIGFANSVLEQEESSNYIIKLSYIATNMNGTSYKYYYKYIGVGAAVHQAGSSKYTYMIIDLVDLWNAGESW